MKSAGSRALWFLLTAALILALVADLRWGSLSMDWNTWWQALAGGEESVIRTVLWQFRIPKALTAWAVGSGLGLAGLLMQSMLRNPIAGPYVLGMSGGAGLMVGIWILTGVALGWQWPVEWGIPVAAALGASAVLLADLWLYYRTRSAVTLLIAGLMIGLFSGALLSLLQFWAPARNLQKFVFWSMGNLGHLQASHIAILWVLIIVSYAAVWHWRGRMDLLLLGDEYVSSAGYSLFVLHRFIVIISGLLAGVITALVGPIAFVGLMVPHAAFLLTGSRLHATALPGVFLLGGILMLTADLLSQLPGSEGVLPVNSITSLLGAPLVVWLLVKRKF